jgi:hypothetical protein
MQEGWPGLSISRKPHNIEIVGFGIIEDSKTGEPWVIVG